MVRKTLKKRLFIASLAAVAVIGMTAAFLTSSDEKDNTFKIAEVDLSISESFEKDKTLAAGQIIQKQPSVINTGSVEQLFFVEVSVPRMETTLVAENGQRIAPTGKTGELPAADYIQSAEIFDLLAASEQHQSVTHDPADNGYADIQYNTPTGDAGGWIYLKQTEDKKNYKDVEGYVDGTYDTYLFGYSVWLPPKGQTAAVFDKLKLRSMVDGDITGKSVGQVTVRAYTVQKDDLNVPGVTHNGTADSQYDKTELTALYKIIENKKG
ncbi:MAG: hypothetical protein IJR91_05555 [Ruminococcus sp.]|nr:hypothetical protein [Ruminococcus sp.]